jgi:hypothetical protein
MTLALQPIQAAGLLITDWCPAACRHCYVSSGPGGRTWMSVEDAEGHFAALARLGVAGQAVHVTGGEPFGDFERLLEIVRAARRAGLQGVGYVETCGHWAVSDDVARGRLAVLAEAGMQQISISADPYHQEFVPPERVRRLLAAAGAVLGPRGVRARRWRWLKDPQDVAALAEPARQAVFRAFLARYPERMTGRAARELASLAARVPLEAIAAGPCREPLLEGRHVHLDARGWIYPGTCAGITLGRATRRIPLDERLGDWHPVGFSAAAVLAQDGPRGLAAEAAERGWRPDAGGYAEPCHLCWSVRTFLAAAGAAGDLGPQTLYET